jgi:hypothetical protein
MRLSGRPDDLGRRLLLDPDHLSEWFTHYAEDVCP